MGSCGATGFRSPAYVLAVLIGVAAIADHRNKTGAYESCPGGGVVLRARGDALRRPVVATGSRSTGTSGSRAMRSPSSRSQASRSSGSRIASRAASALGGVAAAAVGWGWFEAGWVRLRELELEVPGLAARARRAADRAPLRLPPRRAVARRTRGRARASTGRPTRQPDLVAITGDLLTHPRGEPRLRALVERLPQPAFAVLGNHDLAIARDPMARKSNLQELRPARLLKDEGELLELRGKRVWIAGTDPRGVFRRDARRRDPNSLSHEADFRILLCHFPRVFDRLEPGSFDLVLAGHMHDGQITIPYPGGKVRLAHPTARYATGVYRSRRRRDARVAGPRHDICPLPLRREARGDRAGVALPRLLALCYEEHVEMGTLIPMNVKPSVPPNCLPQ